LPQLHLILTTNNIEKFLTTKKLRRKLKRALFLRRVKNL